MAGSARSCAGGLAVIMSPYAAISRSSESPLDMRFAGRGLCTALGGEDAVRPDETSDCREWPAEEDRGGSAGGSAEVVVAGDVATEFDTDDDRESMDDPEPLLCCPIAKEGRGGIRIEAPASEKLELRRLMRDCGRCGSKRGRASSGGESIEASETADLDRADATRNASAEIVPDPDSQL